MAIRISCPNCKSDIHVDENLAGKDILCPSCQGRVTVPSVSARPPEFRSGGNADWDDSGAESREEVGRRRGSLPRYGRDDDDLQVARGSDPARWNGTLTGLGMMFWTGLVLGILLIPLVAIFLFIADDLTRMAAGGVPGNPPPGMAAGLFGIVGIGCVMAIVGLVYFIGMCMCCTVPAESGARGRAITSIVLIVMSVVGLLIFSVVAGIANAQRQQFGAPPQLGQPPFSPAVTMLIEILGAAAGILIVTMWIMFHKAIADYFKNPGLARSSVWYLIAYIVIALARTALQVALTLENPVAAANPFMAGMGTPLVLALMIFGFVTGLVLFVWFMGIIRATRRTIIEGRDQISSRDDDDEPR